MCLVKEVIRDITLGQMNYFFPSMSLAEDSDDLLFWNNAQSSSGDSSGEGGKTRFIRQAWSLVTTQEMDKAELGMIRVLDFL
jgi:hypothetical protein